MKVCPLTRISRNLPQSSPYPDVFYAERVFLYCHGPMEHTVILVGSILQVFQGFVLGLEWESLASQIQFEASNTPQALFLYDRVLKFCYAQLLAGVAYWEQLSCNSTVAINSRCICSQNKRFHQVMKLQYWFL